jgi:hypothetical protein
LFLFLVKYIELFFESLCFCGLCKSIQLLRQQLFNLSFIACCLHNFSSSLFFVSYLSFASPGTISFPVCSGHSSLVFLAASLQMSLHSPPEIIMPQTSGIMRLSHEIFLEKLKDLRIFSDCPRGMITTLLGYIVYLE